MTRKSGAMASKSVNSSLIPLLRYWLWPLGVRSLKGRTALPRDLREGPAARFRTLRAAGRGNVEESQRQDRAGREDGNRQERARENDRRQQVARARRNFRTDHRGSDAARQHVGDGATAEGGRGRVRGGEAVILRRRLKAAPECVAEAEQREALAEDRPGRNGAAEPADERAEHEARASADPRHQERG